MILFITKDNFSSSSSSSFFRMTVWHFIIPIYFNYWKIIVLVVAVVVVVVVVVDIFTPEMRTYLVLGHPVLLGP